MVLLLRVSSFDNISTGNSPSVPQNPADINSQEEKAAEKNTKESLSPQEIKPQEEKATKLNANESLSALYLAAVKQSILLSRRTTDADVDHFLKRLRGDASDTESETERDLKDIFELLGVPYSDDEDEGRKL